MPSAIRPHNFVRISRYGCSITVCARTLRAAVTFRRSMMNGSRKLLLLLAAALLVCPLHAQKEFRKWPTGESPQEIGTRVAEHFTDTPHQNFGQPTPPSQITYPEVAT